MQEGTPVAMKAVGYSQAGEISRADALLDLQLPVPTPGDHDLRVKVAAVSVNPVDTKVRKGRAPQPGVPEVLGWDAVGVVDAVGAAVHDFWPDDPSIPALLRTTAGVPVHLATTHAGDYALFELTLNLADASLTMEDGGLAWRTRRRIASPHFASYQVLDAGERTPGEYMHTMRRAVDNLHAALLDEAPLASTGDTALQAQRLCELIRHAARATTPAPLPALHPFATTP